MEEFPELNEDLTFILGRPNFVAAQYTALYRENGAKIERKAENEQAFFIHLLLSHYFADPVNWKVKVQQEIEKQIEIAKEKVK